jgi:hypothetical protein
VGATKTGVGATVGDGVAVTIGAAGEGDGTEAVTGDWVDAADTDGGAVASVAEADTASTNEPIPMAATTRAASPRASNPRGRLGNRIFMVSLDPLRRPFYFRGRAMRAVDRPEIGPICRTETVDRRTISP